MIWMAGAVFFGLPAAFLLFAGALECRGPGGRMWSRALGLLLLGCGWMALAYAAMAGSTAAYRIARPEDSIPQTWTTPWIVLRWLLPLPFAWLGFLLWTDWSVPRRRAWTVVFLLVPLVAGALHRTLTMTKLLPLTT